MCPPALGLATWVASAWSRLVIRYWDQNMAASWPLILVMGYLSRDSALPSQWQQRPPLFDRHCGTPESPGAWSWPILLGMAVTILTRPPDRKRRAAFVSKIGLATRPVVRAKIRPQAYGFGFNSQNGGTQSYSVRPARFIMPDPAAQFGSTSRARGWPTTALNIQSLQRSAS